MYFVLDCGATKTRLYLVENERLIDFIACDVGVNAVAQQGLQLLKDSIVTLAKDLMKKQGLCIENISCMIAAGMIGSDLGILELPHMPAPVGIHELVSGLARLEGAEVFGLNLPIFIVRGIKNNYEASGFGDIDGVDLMRGEEVQAMGVLKLHQHNLPLNIVELGSTTKLIHIDKDGKIAGSITSLSGQVYGAIIEKTFLSASIKGEEKPPSAFFSEAILDAAVEAVDKNGLLRALMLTRFSQIALNTKWYERRSFLESALCADDIKIFKNASEKLGFDVKADYIIFGNESRGKTYQYLLKNKLSVDASITIISDKEAIENLTLAGCNLVYSAIKLQNKI